MGTGDQADADQASRDRTSGGTASVIAIDVGGTGIKGELLDNALTSLAVVRRDTQADRGAESIVANILAVGTALLAAAPGPVRAAGLALPGVVDPANGTAVWAANLGWRDVPMRQLATDRLGVPTAIGHDMALAGLAEARLGAGKGVPDQLFVGIGTGISGAIMTGGHPITVGHGQAGEIGHVVVQPGGPRCGCGEHGCLEAIASAAAIARRYTELSATVSDSLSGTTASGAGISGAAEGGIASSDTTGHTTGGGTTGSGTTGSGVDGAVDAEFVASRLGVDPIADRVWAEAIDALAYALVTYIRILAPSHIVIGGGLASAGAALFDPLTAAMASRIGFQSMPQLVPAELGTRAGTIGAGLLAAEHAGVPHAVINTDTTDRTTRPGSRSGLADSGFADSGSTDSGPTVSGLMSEEAVR